MLGEDLSMRRVVIDCGRTRKLSSVGIPAIFLGWLACGGDAFRPQPPTAQVSGSLGKPIWSFLGSMTFTFADAVSMLLLSLPPFMGRLSDFGCCFRLPALVMDEDRHEKGPCDET